MGDENGWTTNINAEALGRDLQAPTQIFRRALSRSTPDAVVLRVQSAGADTEFLCRAWIFKFFGRW
jgi:hypothetical protein